MPSILTRRGRKIQRQALLALGRAWTLFGSRKNPKPEKCLKIAQNPQRPVHALFGGVLILNIMQWTKCDYTEKQKRYTEASEIEKESFGIDGLENDSTYDGKSQNNSAVSK